MDQALEAETGPRGLNPHSKVPGTCRPPGSKSLAIRSLLCALLAEGETRLAGIPEGQDVAACLGVLRAAGVQQKLGPGGELCVTGLGPAGGVPWHAQGPLQCGESGTLARLATAIFSFCSDPTQEHRIEVSGSLSRRSSAPLFAALREAGVQLQQAAGEDGWPLSLRPARVPQMLMLQDPCSSQELSALLLALAAQVPGPRGHSVLVMGGLPSTPYAIMTAGVLQTFGVEVTASGAEWRVTGPLLAPAQTLAIETDASGAAVALAAGCLLDQEMRVPGFDEPSAQGDVAILDWLEAFGCTARREAGEWIARGFPCRAVDLDLSGTPDLAPVVAALAGSLSLRLGENAPCSRLRGLETLNAKESRRVEVLADGLRQLGIDVQASESCLTIGASRGLLPGAQQECLLDPHGDHRMAFAFALLGLVREELWVTDPGCVSKSWPGFWEAMGAATYGV